MKTDAVFITLHDLKRLWVRHLSAFKRISLCCFFAIFLFLLLQKPQYLAKSSFKHLHKQSEFSSLAKEIFKDLSLSSENPPIYSIMHSNKVLKRVVEKLGMQISCLAHSQLIDLFSRIPENIASEWGKRPKDVDSFCFRNVVFERQKSFLFYIRPVSKTHFEIFDYKKQKIGEGELGKVVILPECEWTMISFPKKYVLERFYACKIFPWVTVIETIKKQFEIRPNKLEKNIFHLYFKHSDRILAAQFLNQVMKCYQEYYHKENEELCQTQVAYLEKRQEELIKQFDTALSEHVAYLKKNIGETGCVGFANELDILTEPQNLFNSKLFDVDLELQRLDSLYTNAILLPEKNLKNKIKKSSESLSLFPLRQSFQHSIFDSDLEKKRLEHIQHSQETESLDCDALTLQSAKTLYLQYTEKKDQSEAQLREHIFLRDRLHDPDFELSSLSTFLNDPVSVTLAQNASAIALKINDGENRTAREQERLKEELDTQKRFLHQHLTHKIALEKLQLRLLSHKIASLQLQTRHLLDNEKHLLEQKITEINKKMSLLPEKWHRENLLLLKKELGSRIIGSMTQLVETKNLNQKLYQAASKHLDLSFPPLVAESSHFLSYPLIGVLLGCFIYYLFHFCRLLIKGFPLSHENLRLSGLNSHGIFSRDCNQALNQLNFKDKETLRGLIAFLSSFEKPACVALIQGDNPDYSANLAELLSQTGKKSILLRFPFEIEKDTFIRSYPHYDELIATAQPFYSTEKLYHPSFAVFLSHLKQKYDLILIQSSSFVSTKEAYVFTRITDGLILSIREECLEDVAPYRDWAEKKAFSCLACVCYDDLNGITSITNA